MKTRTRDLTTGSIPQHMLRLAAPLILGNILQQLYNAVDAFILGRSAGGLEFAAVGIAGSVMNLFLFMITGACTGVSVIFAQLFGANDLETFRREHFLSLVFGLLCTLVCSGLGFLCLPLLLRVIQTPQELTGYVTAYLTVILISLPAAFVYNLYGALLRAIGRATAALMALAVAVTVNVGLDMLFIAHFGWGIAGAAWATAASQAVSAVICSSTCAGSRRSCCLPAATAVWTRRCCAARRATALSPACTSRAFTSASSSCRGRSTPAART